MEMFVFVFHCKQYKDKNCNITVIYLEKKWRRSVYQAAKELKMDLYKSYINLFTYQNVRINYKASSSSNPQKYCCLSVFFTVDEMSGKWIMSFGCFSGSLILRY